MKLLLSPHNDDECLFAAYTLMREKPLVIIVTDSDLAEGVTAHQRREESTRACELLGVPVVFLGLKDGLLQQQKAELKRRLEPFASQPWSHGYAPAERKSTRLNSSHTDISRVPCFSWKRKSP